jgi:polar amino acid transport system substrate-binding protein
MRAELLGAACLALALCACAAPAAPLVAASDLDHPPFASVDAGGAPRGFEVDLLEELGRALGRRVTWRRLPFAELLDAAAAGEVDLVAATLGVTPERAQRVRFSRPYFHTHIALVAAAGHGFETAQDLAGRRVAFAAGTTAEDAVRRALPRSVPVALAKGDSPAAALAAGRAEAVAVDGPDVALLARAGRVEGLPFDLAAEDYALAFPPDAGTLQAEIDDLLEAWERDGRLARWWSAHAGVGE